MNGSQRVKCGLSHFLSFKRNAITRRGQKPDSQIHTNRQNTLMMRLYLLLVSLLPFLSSVRLQFYIHSVGLLMVLLYGIITSIMYIRLTPLYSYLSPFSAKLQAFNLSLSKSLHFTAVSMYSVSLLQVGKDLLQTNTRLVRGISVEDKASYLF
jgi:uncharacterized membrane protein